jgi:membrane protease YdiL (CAAX protease family)
MSNGSKLKTYTASALIRFIVLYMFISAIATALLLLQIWPHRPTSLRGWIVLVVIAVPVTVIAEWFGDWLLRNRLSSAVDRATKHSKFSWARIFYVLVVVMVVIAVALLVNSHWNLGLM